MDEVLDAPAPPAPIETAIAARAHTLLHYDPQSGRFTHRVDRGKNRCAGEEAGYVNSAGYVSLSIDEKRYYAHRLAWLMVTGAWPLFIDHRDGDRANNRFPNLRDVTRSLNMQNRRTAKATNATGRLGVTIDKRNGRFIAQIVIDRRHVHLGCFDDPDAAHLVYLAAKRTHHEGNTL